MKIKCVNCGNQLKYNIGDPEIICRKCGTIIIDGETTQIGFAKYQFCDDLFVNEDLFYTNQELLNFIEYVQENKNDYVSCVIITKNGENKII